MITLKNPGQESTPGNGVGGFCNDTIERSWSGAFNMGKIIEYQRGQKIGELIYLKDVEPYLNPSGGVVRKAEFLCKCGKIFVSQIPRVKYGGCKSCGCYLIDNPGALTHGLIEHPAYRSWRHMKARCYTKTDKCYKNYGARGITVCDEWRNDFKTYYDYVMGLDNAMQPGLTLDRRNNDGNYEPGNMRWATWHIQAANRRKPKHNKSGYIGISQTKNKEKWAARIAINKKDINLGVFNTLEAAIMARNNYIIDNELFEYPIQKSQ